MIILAVAVVLAQQPYQKIEEPAFIGKINFTEFKEITQETIGTHTLEGHKEETIKEKIIRIAKEKQVDPEIVLAIAEHESGYNPEAEAISPYKRSYGMYQINLKAHPDVTIEQAKDPEFSTHWTVENLISHGYPEDKFEAVARHNGSGSKAEIYARRVLERAGRIKAEELNGNQ